MFKEAVALKGLTRKWSSKSYDILLPQTSHGKTKWIIEDISMSQAVMVLQQVGNK